MKWGKRISYFSFAIYTRNKVNRKQVLGLCRKPNPLPMHLFFVALSSRAVSQRQDRKSLRYQKSYHITRHGTFMKLTSRSSSEKHAMFMVSLVQRQFISHNSIYNKHGSCMILETDCQRFLLPWENMLSLPVRSNDLSALLLE